MATFKKFDNQQVYQLDASKTDGGFEFAVGDVITYNVGAKQVGPDALTTLAEAKQAMDDGLELYLVAQSDAVTYKYGKAYKSYKFDEDLQTVSSGKGTTIVAYRIETLSNIEGLQGDE